jgi:hypothetical protein
MDLVERARRADVRHWTQLRDYLVAVIKALGKR